jgi:hypothetical protein
MALSDRPLRNFADKRERAIHMLLRKPVATKSFSQLRSLLAKLLVRETGKGPASFLYPLNDLSSETPPDAPPSDERAENPASLEIEPAVLRGLTFGIRTMQRGSLSREIKH